MKFNVKKIERCSLCLGCGLCASITNGKCKMSISQQGFIIPDSQYQFSEEEQCFLLNNCPAINLKCTPKADTEFGPIIEGLEAYATNPNIRFKAASGGAVTAICIALLHSNKVNAILQVGKCKDHPYLNELKISEKPEDVLSCASSRYAPVPVFEHIIKILETKRTSTFTFVGKPCDIMTMKRILNKYPEYKSSIKYFISIACAGIPSFNATKQLISIGNQHAKPLYVKYRGEGWPGDFAVEYEDGTIFKCDYHKSWGKVLGRTLNFRCKICPDGMGAEADLVIGDSWHTKDGYPDFSEADGKSFILVRSQQGKELIQLAINDNMISTSQFDIHKLKDMHQYQYIRLQSSYYKLLAAWLCTRGLLHIKGLHVPKYSIFKGIRTALGTIKRFKYLN